jgi:DNA-binding response OmpR family regulator
VARILIVEDDAGVAHTVAAKLAASGHACAVRAKGRGLVDHLKKHRPDVVVLDVMMPDVSGFELCRAIRRDQDLYLLPVLMISAMDGPEEVEHGLAQGADDYLTKPLDLQTLAARVEGLLRVAQGTTYKDALTNLADTEGIKRQLQRKISSWETFSLAYVEMLNLREFARAAGAEAREKATRHLGRCLDQCGRGFSEDEFFVGHLGMGHFMCILPLEKATRYCELALTAWRQHLKTLYNQVGLSGRYKDPEGHAEVLDLLFCVTVCQPDAESTPKRFMDIVSRLRHSAGKEAAGGVYVDRRA